MGTWGVGRGELLFYCLHLQSISFWGSNLWELIVCNLQNVFLTKRSGAYGATETMSEKVKTVPNTQPYPSSSGGS